jgi:hypothetical protein
LLEYGNKKKTEFIITEITLTGWYSVQ